MEQQTQQEDFLSQAMDLIVKSGSDLKTLFDKDGLLKKLTKSLVGRALQAEMSNYLGYDKYKPLLLPKHKTKLPGFNEKVISLYAKEYE